MLATAETALEGQSLTAAVDEPFYYLSNFETALQWVARRCGDLLDADEIQRLHGFFQLPRPARALLVRMIMRRGPVFRASKLVYAEIGDTTTALLPLIENTWLVADPLLTLEALFGLLTKDEVLATFEALPRHARKSVWLEALAPAYADARAFSTWCNGLHDQAVALNDPAWFERMRLLFFGNLQQDWSEFVLAELGIYHYERVAFTLASRAFQCRDDVDQYLALQTCRNALEVEADLSPWLVLATDVVSNNRWIQRRRARVLFQFGQRCEKNRDWQQALAIYEQCDYPGAGVRHARMLEHLQQFERALEQCDAVISAATHEAELQQAQRMRPRLQRRVHGTPGQRGSVQRYAEIELALPRPTTPCPVEIAVKSLLECDAGPVYYVENTLINSLFGLLCWDAIFAPLPGAFFHPFQSGPADLLHPEFHGARQALFERLFAQLETGEYRATMYATFRAKQGLQSPFVYWGLLDETLLDTALRCIPAAHLRALFTRLLQDIKNNRAGLPDLIQFWPDEQRYQMIEVKGPGDRLQDNQKRWLDYCLAHAIPVAVSYVQWQT